MIEIRFDKTKDEVALLIWFLVDHSVVFGSVKMNRMSERIKLSWSNEPSQIKSHQPDPQKHLKLHRLFL
jgi:hypothetical protein